MTVETLNNLFFSNPRQYMEAVKAWHKRCETCTFCKRINGTRDFVCLYDVERPEYCDMEAIGCETWEEA